MKIIANNRIINFDKPLIMGILNVTPDSFSDGGKYNTITSAITHSYNMIKNGASIIDIGGESTKPNSKKISYEEEADRVIPILIALSKRFDVILSVDTSKKLIMRESIRNGVHLINDVTTFKKNNTLSIISHSKVAICLMHSKINKFKKNNENNNINILQEIKYFFINQIKRCKKFGIKKNRLILDPGFGFGKNLYENYKILSNLKYFSNLKLPLLVGMSRKSMIGKIMRKYVIPSKRIAGSVACAVLAALQGACIIRAHDVKQTSEALLIVNAITSKGNIFNE
ncbi:MAG: dihydropteroate synthase [Enterobacterales bacterium]